MSLSAENIKFYTNGLKGFLVGDELNNLLASQGQLNVFQKKLTDYQSGATTLNREFNERHGQITPYSLPTFATNQDLILLAFLCSYAFLTFVTLITIFKNTGNIQNVIYALLMSIVILLIVTSILLRAA
jgi:hypothetical protein